MKVERYSGVYATFGLSVRRALYTDVLSDYIDTTNPAPAFSPCGLDTLYIALPKSVRFTTTVEQLRRELPRYGQPKEDLRPLGFPLILRHPNYIYGKKASRILQFIGVGGMHSDSILNPLDAVVDTDPLDLRVQRADLCAGWSGISIDHCRRSLKVRNKRKTAEYRNPKTVAELFEKECRESGRYETLYYGPSKSRACPCFGCTWKRTRKTMYGTKQLFSAT